MSRLARDWARIPEPRVELEAVPSFARDLDVFGHASLWKLLGTASTPLGKATLARWLLEPAAPDEVPQALLEQLGEDLAVKAETLVTERALDRSHFEIPANAERMVAMCDLVQQRSPRSKIILGGHGAAIEDVELDIDCDHVVKGEGVRWLRSFLGQDPGAPLVHPVLPSTERQSIFGVPVPGPTATWPPWSVC